jgi:hypothetical protein
MPSSRPLVPLSSLPEYTTILSQCVAKDALIGKPLLILGTESGQISAISIDKLVERRTSKDDADVKDAVVAAFTVGKDDVSRKGGKVLSLDTLNADLVVGGVGSISCYSLDSLTSSRRSSAPTEKSFIIDVTAATAKAGAGNLQPTPTEVGGKFIEK